MSRTTFSHSSYGIGIICALVEEKAAMEMMLDEEHDQLEQQSRDHNSYTFGKIGKHNVVIACLPGGHQGKAAAATVAVHMLYSFPIKLGLMVGIGGGVPSQVPAMRLGDVVVSMPEGTHGGVIQYDLGKLESDGFRRKGHLDKPPKALLSAVTSLRAKHERREPEFPRYLSGIAENSRMATKYGFQGAQHDRLFASDEVHPKDHHTCDHCVSTLRMVQRAYRDDDTPQVFYGTILSGDLVMKNGEERDKRAAADKALCFEIEAAGLMNDFPCLVIRGISDYSDSHKNDRWQPYAAATAAAYAKELLSALSAQEVEKLGPAKKHLVPFSLKGVPAIDHFVQRISDMQKLEEYFFPQPQQPIPARRKMFVVHGLGGIGKTQLCIEFVRRHQEKYNAVFWFDGSSQDALQRSFLNAVARLPADEAPLALVHAAEKASPDQQLIVRGVLDWFSLTSNRQWLLVIDNVDRDHTAKVKDPLAYDIKQYLPTADHGNVLVTSRLSTLTAPRNSMRLAEVDRDQGRAILGAMGGETLLAQDESSVDALLDRLSGLPLALTQAAAYIGQTAVSIAQYLEYYDNMWKDLMEQQDEYPLQEYAERSVLTTWRISYDQVKRQSTEAANLLRLWSFLYAGDLWYELIACTEEFRAETDVPEWLTSLTRNELLFDRALRLLIKFSLVEGKTQTASYAMHSVLHSWCRHIGETEAERISFWELAIDIVGFMVPETDVKEYWVLQRRLIPHAQAIFTSVKWQTRAGIHLRQVWAIEQMAYMFRYQNRYAEAEELYKQVLVRRDKALGTEHIDTLLAVYGMGTLYHSQGKFAEAEKMYKQAIAGQEKILGPKHEDTLCSVHNLGRLYREQGKLAEAERILKQALVHMEKLLGLEHIETLATVHSLGSIHLDQGMLAEAEDMFNRSLSGFEKALGAEHTETLATVYCLGKLYAEQDRPADAEEMYERALAGFEKAFGPEHTKTLGTMLSLGHFYAGQSRLAKAEKMYERTLAGYERVLGPEHGNTVITVYNSAIVQAEQSRLEEAEELFERALVWYEKAFGPEHKDTLDAVYNLGVLYARQDRLARAEEMYERALAGHEKAFGPEHQRTLDTAWNLSIVYEDQGRHAEAEEMFRRARGKERPPEHEHMSTVNEAQYPTRTLPSQLTISDDMTDNEAASSECSTPRQPKDATLCGFSMNSTCVVT